MGTVQGTRELLRVKDLLDTRFVEPWTVDELAGAAHLSRAHFSREFARAFGEPPHRYLLTRRLERAAALLRTTDWTVARIVTEVGATSVGSFTSAFRRVHGRTPTQYRADFPPAQGQLRIPRCVALAYARPQNRTFGEDPAVRAVLPSADVLTEEVP